MSANVLRHIARASIEGSEISAYDPKRTLGCCETRRSSALLKPPRSIATALSASPPKADVAGHMYLAGIGLL
jgi:hypothetical protein